MITTQKLSKTFGDTPFAAWIFTWKKVLFTVF
jgi:hypothetical protein